VRFQGNIVLTAKKMDVDEINLKIQVTLPAELISFKSIDIVIDEI